MHDTYRFKFGEDAIGHLLQDRRLAVPVYQRSYAWNQEQIGEYWSDLRPGVGSTSEYFIGTIVLSKEGASQPGYSAIIDGQQRLATTAMVYAAICAELADRGEAKRASMLERKYLVDEDEHAGDERPRLRMNSDDDPYFHALIVKRSQPTALQKTSDSHARIETGYALIRKLVREDVGLVGSSWIERLLAWAKYLAHQVRVVTVDVPTEADAFTVFETLNDRGADLTIADLLKNFLFRLSGDSINTVRDRWMKCLGALDVSAENAAFTAFLRHAWSSRHGSTRERELYRSIKDRVVSSAQALQLSADLLESAHHYAAILKSDHEFWVRLGTTARTNVETLSRFELEQMRPLMLALMQHFAPAELRTTLRALVRWSVRQLIAGGIGGGTAEKHYCDAAVAVRAGNVKTAAELLAVLDPIVPTDTVFESAFALATVTKARLARYYLLALESVCAGAVEPELVPNSNEEEVNLEHVLPKTYSAAEWPTFTSDEHKAHLHRLGNLALLQKTPNGRIGNGAFAIKMPVLAASSLALTKEIGAVAKWDPAAIHTRQVALARLALKTWPRDPSL